jgi:hypothetical protein
MANVVRIVKALVLLAIASFIVMVIVGVYTALDAAPVYTLATSAEATEEEGAGYVSRMIPLADDAETGNTAGTAASDKATIGEEADAAEQPGQQDTGALGQLTGQVPLAPTPTTVVGSSTAQSPSPASALAQPGTQAQQQPPASSPISQQDQTPVSPGGAPAAQVQPRVWHEPVYQTIHHDAVYRTVHHDAEYIARTEYFTRCNDCGFLTQNSIYPHQDETGHTRYSTDVPITSQVLIRAAFDEQVLVSGAFDEKVLITPGYWE